MTRITDIRRDIQVESSGWLFKSLHAGAGAFMVAAPLQATHLVRTALQALSSTVCDHNLIP